MALDSFVNFAKVSVSTGYSSTATTVVLNAGQGALLPVAPFNATWWNVASYPDPSDDPNVEIVRVTAISTDTLTVTRGQEGTVASPKNVGSAYKMVAALTALTLSNISTGLSSSVQSVVNDTNVTGSLASNALTLGFTGQLSIPRGGTGASTASAALTALGGASLSASNTFGGTISGLSFQYFGPTLTATGSANTLWTNPTLSGTGITTFADFNSLVVTAASSSVSASYGFRTQLTLGASSSINVSYGVGISGPNLGTSAAITTRTGLYIQAQAATGITTAYGIQQQGASDLNTFAGATTFSNSLKVNSSTTTIALSTPGAPTVTPTGTAGTTSYSYTVVALQSDGSATVAGTAGTTSTGNATLSGTNYNALSWTAVTNAASYSVYRTVSGGSPSSTGKIAAAQTALTLNDTGLAASGSSPTSNTTGALTVAGPATLAGKITSYNGVSTVANGVGSIVAQVDLTVQSANIALTTFYTVPAGGAGLYRISVYAVLTQAATTSSVLPTVGVFWTDADSSVASSPSLTATSSANVVGTASYGLNSTTISSAASTNIKYQTISYASSGATPMQYALHIRLEYLG